MLHHEVVHILRPALYRRVTEPGTPLHDDLDHTRVEGVGRVDRRRAPLDIVCIRPLIGDDQGPLELTELLGIHTEVSLERRIDRHTLRDVDEGSTRPDRRVQRRKLVVTRGDDSAEVLTEELGVELETILDRLEDDTLILPLLLERVVDHLRLVLSTDTSEDPLLGLRDTETLEGLLDLGRNVVPRTLHPLLRLEVEVDLIEGRSEEHTSELQS